MIQTNNEYTVCVLISCMNQSQDIIDKTHVQTNVVVVNQCNEQKMEEWDFKNPNGQICHAKFISTTERGLSKSRNMAIRNANGDICIICDDDEELVDGYEKIVLEAYMEQPKADLISFAFDRKDKTYPNRPSYKHTIKTLSKISSVEITFLLKSILNNDLLFDEKMGSGSGNGPGEETMFLMMCWRYGLQMYYNPHILGKLLSNDSRWFNGYTKRYFENLGWSARRVYGSFMSIPYFGYWLLKHRKLYIHEISSIQAISSYIRGWISIR